MNRISKYDGQSRATTKGYAYYLEKEVEKNNMSKQHKKDFLKNFNSLKRRTSIFNK